MGVVLEFVCFVNFGLELTAAGVDIDASPDSRGSADAEFVFQASLEVVEFLPSSGRSGVSAGRVERDEVDMAIIGAYPIVAQEVSEFSGFGGRVVFVLDQGPFEGDASLGGFGVVFDGGHEFFESPVTCVGGEER